MHINVKYYLIICSAIILARAAIAVILSFGR